MFRMMIQTNRQFRMLFCNCSGCPLQRFHFCAFNIHFDERDTLACKFLIDGSHGDPDVTARINLSSARADAIEMKFRSFAPYAIGQQCRFHRGDCLQSRPAKWLALRVCFERIDMLIFSCPPDKILRCRAIKRTRIDKSLIAYMRQLWQIEILRMMREKRIHRLIHTHNALFCYAKGLQLLQNLILIMLPHFSHGEKHTALWMLADFLRRYNCRPP